MHDLCAVVKQRAFFGLFLVFFEILSLCQTFSVFLIISQGREREGERVSNLLTERFDLKLVINCENKLTIRNDSKIRRITN